MLSFVTLTLGLSSPSYLDVVEFNTNLIMVMKLLKVELFICALFVTICFTVLAMGSIWNLIEPIIENPVFAQVTLLAKLLF
jgi:hypothetical protein